MLKKKDYLIVEKRLGIPSNYQYNALRSANFLQSNWHNNKLQVLRVLLDLDKIDSLLDLGIGSGNFEIEFSNKVKSITAVDYNNEAISFARTQLKKLKISNVNFVVADIRNVHKILKSKRYDLILIVDVIEHVSIKEAKKIILNLKSLLKRGGRVCVITPNYNSPWQLLEIILDKISTLPMLDDEQHLGKFYRKNLTGAFEKHGYKTVFFSTFNLFSWLVPTKKLSTFLVGLELKTLKKGGNLLVGVFQKN